MWNEAKLVMSNLNIERKLCRRCDGVRWKRVRAHDLEEMNDGDGTPEKGCFRECVFYILVDNAIAG